ncbi:hypothetical protein OHS17_01000 [Streptomyces sp. NBC_00523]|uniref:hypothetical protein n=1 Tax=Streptomyces sp. NBC_00523 TaxID=2975765 RepID=UPI002E815A84|nr:hypothetical protein [Streptomyces sp. NBC_00523]WUC98318.1 hypothetical protein OHS17_01000 [Streptomyces sp. NBC_00523]
MTLTGLRDGFRDVEQRQRVQAMIASRLADDREPQGCRYLMRFWWQLSMPYREVSVAELRLNVGQQKPEVAVELVSAIRASHEEIGAWLCGSVQTFPVLQDHGFSATLDSRGCG